MGGVLLPPSVFVFLQNLLHSHPQSLHPQAGGSPGGRMSPNPRMLGGSLPTPPPLRPPNTGTTSRSYLISWSADCKAHPVFIGILIRIANMAEF